MSDARNTSAPRAAVLRVLASASSAPPPTHIPTLKSCVRTLDSDTAPVPRARSGYLETAVGLGHRLGLARVEVKAVHVEAWREGTSTSQGRRGRGRTTRVRRRERARSRGGGGEVARRDWAPTFSTNHFQQMFSAAKHTSTRQLEGKHDARKHRWLFNKKKGGGDSYVL